MSNPKEKAIELVKKYVEFKIDGQHRIFGIELSKQCALIAVDEILLREKDILTRVDGTWGKFEWQEVKQEIEKL
jgi:hypothetical protein